MFLPYGTIDPENHDYQMDYVTCMLIASHQKQHSRNIYIPGIIPKNVADSVLQLPIHKWMYDITSANAMNKEDEELLWHQRLIHGGDHNYDNLHKHVGGVPNLSEFKFDDVTKCSTCLQVKLTKDPAGTTSLREQLKVQYQGLFMDFGFSGNIQRDKEWKEIEASRPWPAPPCRALQIEASPSPRTARRSSARGRACPAAVGGGTPKRP